MFLIVHIELSLEFLRRIGPVSLGYLRLSFIPVYQDEENHQADVHASVRNIDPCPNGSETTTSY